MMESAPIASVIIPTRDRPDKLKDALRSVLEQSMQDMEILVVEDGSSPEARKRYEDFSLHSDSRIRWIFAAPGETGHYGPSENRNRGIRSARGQFVAFLDDDDYWLAKDHLETGIAALESSNGDLFFASWRNEYDGQIVIPDFHRSRGFAPRGRVVLEEPRVLEISKSSFFSGMMHGFITHLNTCIVRKSVLDEVGGLYSPIQFAEDQHLVARIADCSRAILHRPEVVANFEVTPRTRAFSAYSDVDKELMVAAMARHLYVHAKSKGLRKAARGLESSAHIRAARLMLDDHQPARALLLAGSSVLARGTRSSLMTFLTSFAAWSFGRAFHSGDSGL